MAFDYAPTSLLCGAPAPVRPELLPAVTVLPNALLDRYLGALPPLAWVMLLHLYRVASGFNEGPAEADADELAGIAHTTLDAVLDAMAPLEMAGLVRARCTVGDGVVYELALGE